VRGRETVLKRSWKKHEEMVRKRIDEWIRTGKPCSLTKLAWDIAGYVYNNGGGFIFMDFNERTQKCFLVSGYMDWIIQLTNGLEHLNEKQDRYEKGKMLVATERGLF